MIANITQGWQVCDVVTFVRTWCVICTKQRTHEKYGKWIVCLGCNYDTEAAQ